MEENLFVLLRSKFINEQIEFAVHATKRMLQRTITVQQIIHAVVDGRIVEDYPDDVYGPSCLILGDDGMGKPLHVVCSYPQRLLIKVISVYHPDPTKWEAGFTKRKKP